MQNDYECVVKRKKEKKERSRHSSQPLPSDELINAEIQKQKQQTEEFQKQLLPA